MYEYDFVEIVANGLKVHCVKWGHNEKLIKLKQDDSVKNFRKLFCNITNLYYCIYQDICYSITFDKVFPVAHIKRCGKDYDKRDVDATIHIEEVIKLLVTGGR